MSQWKSTDNTTSSPLWGPCYVNKTPNSTNQNNLYQNVTANAFINGVAIGVFGIAANEIAAQDSSVAHTGWVLRRVGTGGRAGRIQTEVLVAGGFATDTVADSGLYITIQSLPQTVNTLQTTTFLVAATDDPAHTITYKWQANTGAGLADLSDAGVYSNTSTAVLSISNTAGLNGVSYACKVQDGVNPNLVSSNALLTVTAAVITIVTQPANTDVANNAGTSLTVNATVTPVNDVITYQWQIANSLGNFNNLAANANYSGVTTATLTIANASAVANTLASHGAIFRVVLNATDAATVNSTNAVSNTA